MGATKFYSKDKCTVYVSFSITPLRIEVLNEAGKIYYFRELSGQKNIKFNICHKGHYTINEDCTIDKITDIEITPLNMVLPPPDRDKMKPFTIVHNNDLVTTPARNFVNKGIIETGRYFNTFPFPIRLFILCHEVGHFLYGKEEDADLYACKIYLENGYNKSNAFYALTKVLRANVGNKKRVLELFKILTS